MKLNIGTNIKRLRGEKGVTQEQLAAAMNVSCAAVSKWERSETYPDITLLQPLAYYFGVTLDQLMGYDSERIKAQIDLTLEEYFRHYAAAGADEQEKAREIITNAYREYPNDHRVMSYYMWHIAGGSADNDPEVLLAHKEELLAICDKILSGCNDIRIRLSAWDMQAKILHTAGKTNEALDIYREKFASWYMTGSQKSEQLFSKDTDEYYFWVHRNMYELFSFAADKLGRTVFFDKNLTSEEKTEKALLYCKLLTEAYEKTGDDVFLVIAKSFIGRTENDLCYRGGTDDDIVKVTEKYLECLSLLGRRAKENSIMYGTVFANNKFWEGAGSDLAGHMAKRSLKEKTGRRAALLGCPEYKSVLDKYA